MNVPSFFKINIQRLVDGIIQVVVVNVPKVLFDKRHVEVRKKKTERKKKKQRCRGSRSGCVDTVTPNTVVNRGTASGSKNEVNKSEKTGLLTRTLLSREILNAGCGVTLKLEEFGQEKKVNLYY